MSTLSIAPTFVPARRSSSSVRLTRRGRVVVVLTALALVLLAAFFLGSGAVGTDTPGQAEPTTIIMVSPGDTLWGIAAELNADGDVRATMREIERLNALDSVSLAAGQKLRVPVSVD